MLFLDVYNDNSNLIQALEGKYIDSNCLYSQKRLICFSVTQCEKSGCGRTHSDMIFKKIELCVHIKYKTRLLEAQVFKSYRTFVIQKSYGGREFLFHPV